jgi:hypothetical protein
LLCHNSQLTLILINQYTLLLTLTITY